MLTIRLQRTGKRNHAQFRIVLAEKTAHVSKKFAEVLGSYNPHKKELSIGNTERLNYWISQHVHISPTVHNLLVTKGLLKEDKVKSFNIPKKKEEETPAEAPQAEAAAAPEAQVESKPEEVKEESVAAEAPAEEPKAEEKPAE